MGDLVNQPREGTAAMGGGGNFSEEYRAPVKSREILYKAFSQTVLLYGSEIWSVMDVMMKFLEGFTIGFHDGLRG